MPMSRTVISDIIYPVQTKKGLKWGKNQKHQDGLQTPQRAMNKGP